METYATRGVRPETEERHSIADLLRELREESVTLVKQEAALAKAEMKEKASRVGRNAIFLATGGLIGFAGFLFLLVAGMRGISLGLLQAGFDPLTVAWLSPVILGATVLLIGVILASKGWKTISHESFVPKRTIKSIKEEASWTREKLKEA